MRPVTAKNFFSDIPTDLHTELVESVVQRNFLKIERILSSGQASEPGFWYDQEWDEWVLVVTGEAGLRFENSPNILHMKAGDHVLIPAHCRHRVEWTSQSEKTFWVAVHFRSDRQCF